MSGDEFPNGWQESLAELKAAHEEPIAPAHFAAVRARVMGELARRQRPLWTRGWVWGLAAAVAVAVMVGIHVDLRPRLEPPAVALAYPAAPVVAKAARRTVAVARAVPRPAVRRAKAEPLLIRIVTDDPDVVIYWIADTRGDE